MAGNVRDCLNDSALKHQFELAWVLQSVYIRLTYQVASVCRPTSAAVQEGGTSEHLGESPRWRISL